ncbi:MAG TPA: 30S ribosomal protein S5 [Candidatus Paceibacterota bacterium]|nr:30S ribosomal protein S5 [Candidatus Paceibacterota bacterium]HPT40046.1 30S ribosomal protein S5 [Candidatus Paceibacterota bacterium]
MRPHFGRREEKIFDEKLLDLRRVVRVTAGGKRFSFRATLVIGDKKGRVAVGIAKGKDVAQAIAKAKASAEKRLINVPIIDGTIPHEITAKYCAAQVLLKPAKEGHGLVAGGPVRIVCDLAGIRNLSAKILGRTPNKLSNARATLEALKNLKPATRKQAKAEVKEVEEK